jgi:outer membrane protein assembly factor BamB
VRLSDGLLVAYWRRYDPGTSPRLVRIDDSGAIRWSVDIPSGWATERPPRDYHPVAWTEPLFVSGDLALVSFEEQSSGIGRSSCVDIRTGDILWHTPAGPQGGQSILGRDRFLIGVQGNGRSSLAAVERDGTESDRWDRHAWPIVGDDGVIRGVEIEDVLPSTMRVSTFAPGGQVTRGPQLDGTSTSYPALAADGSIVFWRESEGLLAVGPDLVKHALWADPAKGAWTATTRTLIAADGSIVFGMEPPRNQDWGSGDPDAMLRGLEESVRVRATESRLIVVASSRGPLAGGPWPCAGGNAGNNPVLG